MLRCGVSCRDCTPLRLQCSRRRCVTGAGVFDRDPSLPPMYLRRASLRNGTSICLNRKTYPTPALPGSSSCIPVRTELSQQKAKFTSCALLATGAEDQSISRATENLRSQIEVSKNSTEFIASNDPTAVSNTLGKSGTETSVL